VVYIGNKLNQLRTREALTQRDLSERTGLTIAAISRIERNQVEPHLSNVRKLAEALGVHPSQLIEDQELNQKGELNNG
jgi:transcriptional regulator with XRE-family HTH domain